MILAFDTATCACTVAVGKDEKMLAEKTVRAPQRHLETLLLLIDEVLKTGEITTSDIDVVAVGLGPGSFTGIRIGVSTAKGLAQALDKPLAGVSTLDILACGLLPTSSLICPVIDAKRGQVYFAVYREDRGKLERLTDYQSLEPEDFCKQLEGYNQPITVTGDALDVYQPLFKRKLGDFCRFPSEDKWFPKASDILPLAAERIRKKETKSCFELAPTYVRIPIAEENWQKRMSKKIKR